MKKTIFLVLLAMASTIALFPRPISVQSAATTNCPPPSHPKIMPQGDTKGFLLAHPEGYPGVTMYFVGESVSTEEMAIFHSRGWKIIGMSGMWGGYDPAALKTDLQNKAALGYDQVIIDEAIWILYHSEGKTKQEATAMAVAAINPAIDAAKVINPNFEIAVVEPFKEFLWLYLQAGGRADYISGEDYGPSHPGDVRQDDLLALKNTYGIKTQQWVYGAEKVMAYENTHVDIIIAADIHASWGLIPVVDYSSALASRLSLSCKVYIPLAVKSP